MPSSRRPDAGFRRAARLPTRASARQRVTRDSLRAAATRSSGRFTTRAAVLALVLCAMVLTAAVPLREFLAQRAEISSLESGQAEQRERVAALETQRTQLQDPEHVRRLARERLHFVLPGETAYEVLRPSPAPSASPAEGPVPAKGGTAPWWSQVWSSVETADRG